MWEYRDLRNFFVVDYRNNKSGFSLNTQLNKTHSNTKTDDFFVLSKKYHFVRNDKDILFHVEHRSFLGGGLMTRTLTSTWLIIGKCSESTSSAGGYRGVLSDKRKVCRVNQGGIIMVSRENSRRLYKSVLPQNYNGNSNGDIEKANINSIRQRQNINLREDGVIVQKNEREIDKLV